MSFVITNEYKRRKNLIWITWEYKSKTTKNTYRRKGTPYEDKVNEIYGCAYLKFNGEHFEPAQELQSYKDYSYKLTEEEQRILLSELNNSEPAKRAIKQILTF